MPPRLESTHETQARLLGHNWRGMADSGMAAFGPVADESRHRVGTALWLLLTHGSSPEPGILSFWTSVPGNRAKLPDSQRRIS
jgi:hypothetical protein